METSAMTTSEAAEAVVAGELRTPRLVFRLPEPSLAPALSDYHLRNTAHFAPYSPRREQGFHAVQAWEERASALQQESLSGQALHLLLFRADAPTQNIVGEIAFTNIVRGVFQAGYLGYKLDAQYLGQGLMFEALTASIAHVFQHLNLHRLMANYVPSNERSGRLLRRLGFTVEGYARDYLLLDGVWKDHLLTSLTNAGYRVV
jgi:[ribosomal protein S5]-alanine N-acetyltransferase